VLANDDGRVPSVGHLHELVIVGLKSIPLFSNMSRRLIDDLVANIGIDTAAAMGAPSLIDGREPIVLLVLERPVLVHLPNRPPIRLLPGTYLRDHPPFDGPTTEAHAWAVSSIRSADDDRSRVFLIDRGAFEQLPQAVLQALDHAELEHLKEYLSR
jgi:hypothetical protein